MRDDIRWRQRFDNFDRAFLLLLSHTYDSKVFETALQVIVEKYFPAFDRLHEFFLLQRLEP
ncbi:MAG: hypothetical protein HQL64_11035 [Magnetococcales bacterium]|nr:hypothetical protein [Magnetococcales bacterium]